MIPVNLVILVVLLILVSGDSVKTGDSCEYGDCGESVDSGYLSDFVDVTWFMISPITKSESFSKKNACLFLIVLKQKEHLKHVQQMEFLFLVQKHVILQR